MSRRTVLAFVALATALAASCSSTTATPPQGTAPPGTAVATGHRPKVDASVPTAKAGFTVQPGVEVVMVTGANPGAKLTLVDQGGDKLLTVKADPKGQAVWSYIPTDWMEIDPTENTAPPTS